MSDLEHRLYINAEIREIGSKKKLKRFKKKISFLASALLKPNLPDSLLKALDNGNSIKINSFIQIGGTKFTILVIKK